jgi:hypothetical protein
VKHSRKLGVYKPGPKLDQTGQFVFVNLKLFQQSANLPSDILLGMNPISGSEFVNLSINLG